MADASRQQIGYVVETTFGDVVSGSALQLLPFATESLDSASDTMRDPTIRSDRQTSDVIRTRFTTSGAINHALRYSAWDAFFLAGIQSDSAWTTLVSYSDKTTISASSVDNSFNDSASGLYSAGFLINRWIEVRGFTTAANNGYFKIVSVVAGKIVVSGGTLVTEDADDSVTVKMGANIYNGVTCPSYNIECKYTDITKYLLYTGMCVEGFNLSIPAAGEVSGAFNFLGSSKTTPTDTVGTSYTAASTNKVFTGVNNIKAVLENQSTILSDVLGLNFEVKNNLYDRLYVGGGGNVLSIGSGSLDVTGSMELYFNDTSIIDKNLDFDTSSLALVFEDDDGNAYIFDMPRVKYTQSPSQNPGNNQDVMVNASFESYMHPTEEVTMRIARFDA